LPAAPQILGFDVQELITGPDLHLRTGAGLDPESEPAGWPEDTDGAWKVDGMATAILDLQDRRGGCGLTGETEPGQGQQQGLPETVSMPATDHGAV
jgi:hypothetical protein